MSPLYPLSVHRRPERQWANRMTKPVPGQIDVIERNVLPTISGHPLILLPVIAIEGPAQLRLGPTHD